MGCNMNKFSATLSFIFIVGCSTAISANNPSPQETQRDLPNQSMSQQGAGFITAEAKQLLEFCIELNNQDDRANFPSDNQYKANLGDWIIEQDSRNKGDNNPETNGFGPFNNAWLLLKSKTDPTQFAIAIRGTVGEAHSIIDDFLLTTIPGQNGIEFPSGKRLPIVFAATPEAEVHLGFAYAAFTILFDKERGILTQLKDTKIPENAKLFITGHSQGAAIATLVHSFLYYALTDEADRYGIGKKKLQIKSYLFAQPKPGNLQYASDLARIAGSKGHAFVINNLLDPVPQIPLSIQTPADVSGNVINESKDKGKLLDKVLLGSVDRAFELVKFSRNAVATKVLSETAKKLNSKYGGSGAGADHLDIASYFKPDENPEKRPATSLNYTLAGQLIPVFGFANGGTLYPPSGNKPDLLLQHHATTYRKLINQQIP